MTLPIELRLPQIGDTGTSVKLGVWLKQEGDTVEAGEPIAEVETDKTNVELEAPASGVVDKIHVEAGTDGLETGVLLVVIAEGNATGKRKPGSAASRGPARPATPDAPPERARAADTESPTIQTEAVAQPAEDPRATLPAQAFSDPSTVAASPLAGRLAMAAGLNLSTIQGTGRGGRISKADVERVLAERSPTPLPERSAAVQPAPVTIRANELVVPENSFQEQPLSTMRRVTAVRLQQAKQTIPHFYLRVECAVDAVLQLRSRLNAQIHDVKLTLTDIMVRAAALALRKVPQANSTWADNTVRVYDAADVAVAVNTPTGLITPIIRQADRKGLAAISREMKVLTERARQGALEPEEYTGGTFTISNLGMYGVDSLYAIVNPPQSCILGVGAAVKRPIVAGDKVVVGTVSTCTLSADHRAIDGATGAELLVAFRMFIEEPGLLAL